MKKLILHIPHSSKYIPNEVRDQFCISKEEVDNEILKMTDHFTDELFDLSDVSKVVYPISRLVLDPERFSDDELESMSKIGHGVVYKNTSSLTSLRRDISELEKNNLINFYYIPHHHKLNKLAEEKLIVYGECLVVDCHSFPKYTLPYELKINGNLERPEICLGADEFHTSKLILENAYNLFSELGYYVSINKPFTGTLIPGDYYQKNQKVQGLMIEIRRDLYMNEQTGGKIDNFEKLKKDLSFILSQLSDGLL